MFQLINLINKEIKMKKIIVNIIFIFAILLTFSSCKKSLLNVTPVDRVSDDAVFNSTDPGLMRAFVNNIYLGIMDGFQWGKMADLTDEAQMNSDYGINSIMLSQITPSNLICFTYNFWTTPLYVSLNWVNLYKYVRATNLFLSKVKSSPADEASKDELKGEVFFLRAYLYHRLVDMYGGVPLIKKAYTLSSNFDVPRNSFADCVQFISDQCDSAAKYLPLTQSQWGRATKGAALALKARVLLYAASALYNTPSTWGSYAHPELVGYTDVSASARQARWQKAKDAAKAVMDLGVYSLYMPDPASKAEAIQNYENMFLSMRTSEDIFCRYFTKNDNTNWDTYNPGLFQNPNGWHGWGKDTPTEQFVEKYEMSDGTNFSWSNPTEAANPYENRDPRFYATVLYNGAKWRPRPSDVTGDPVGIVQTGHYYSTDGTIRDGLDTRGNNGGVDTWNGGYTGYYLRKFVDPKIDPLKTIQTYPWRFIRYTGVLLDYAEACMNLGDNVDAIKYINEIRKRAYMPPIPASTSGPALVKALRYERTIELAFEGQRYMDIRRWMICDSAFQDAEAIDITYGSPTDRSSTYGTGQPTYKVVDFQPRHFDPKFYFLPISQTEMDKNSKLVQNPFYQ